MPKLLSGQILRDGGSGQYITLPGAQPALGPSPSTSTGFTLITSPTGITSYTNILGNISFEGGTLTNTVLDQNITINGYGTSTFVVNTPVLFNNSVVFANSFTFVDLLASGHVRFSGGYNSTASTNGTLVVTGGVGITQDVFIGGALTTEGLLNADGPVNLNSKGADVNIEPSLGGTVIIRPDVAGRLDNVDIGLTIRRQGKFTYLDASNQLTASSTASSTSTNTGALVVTGGVGIGGSIYADKIYDNNLRVISQINTGLGLSGGGNGPLLNLNNTGVLSLTAGTGTFVNTTTGDVTVWTYGNTLQLVTEQGNTTNRQVFFNNTANATTATTGSVVIAGGLGVGKDIYVQGNIYASNLNPDILRANAAIFTTTQVTGLGASTSTLANNALFVAGGAGIQGGLTVGGNTFLYGSLTVLGTYTVTVSTVADLGRKVVALSTSAGPAILSIDSGITVGPISNPFVKWLFDGVSSWKSTGNIIPATNTGYNLGSVSYQWNTIYGQTLKVSGATASTDPSNGALTVVGGVGVGGNINVSGNIKISDTTRATSTITGALIVAGGVGIGGNVQIGSLTSATNTLTGALIVAGGAGFGGNVYALNFFDSAGNQFVTTSTINQYGVTNLSAGTDTAVSTTTGVVKVWNTSTLQSITQRGASTNQAILFANTTNSVNSTTGAVIISGGAAIKKDLYVGGNVIVYGNSTFNGTITNVLSTNTVYTDNIIELHLPTTGTWNINDGKDIGIKMDYYSTVSTAAFLGRANDSGYLEWYGSGVETNGSTFTGFYGTFKTGSARLVNNTRATSTGTGALIVSGGIGVSGDIWAYDIYANGSKVLTAASLSTFGLSAIHAGTDTAVSSETGDVTIWNTSTLQSVTDRGNSTNNPILVDNTLTVNQTIFGNGSLQLVGSINASDAYLANVQAADLTLSGKFLSTNNSIYPVSISVNTNNTTTYLVKNINSGTSAYSGFRAENDQGGVLELGISSSNRSFDYYGTGSAYLYVSPSINTFNIGDSSAIKLYTQGYGDAGLPTLDIGTTGTVTLISDFVITDNNYSASPHATLMLESSANVGYTSITMKNTGPSGQSFTFDLGGNYRSAHSGAGVDEGNLTLRDDIVGAYRLIVAKTTGNVLVGKESDDGVNKLQVGGSFTATSVSATTATFLNLNVLQTSTFHENIVILETLDVKSTATFEGGLISKSTGTFEKSVVLGSSLLETTRTSINTTGPTQIDSFDATLYRSARCLIQITDGDTFHLVEIVLLHDNWGQIHKSEYGIIATNAQLGEFTTDLVSGQVKLYFTAYDATSKQVNVVKTAISV